MLRRLAQIELGVAFALLAIIVGLVFTAAVMRFFGRPIIWSVDMAQLLFIWLCMLGASRAMREKGHIGIDLLARILPQRHRLVLEMLLSAAILVFLTMLAIEGTKLAVQNAQRTFGDSGISYAWVTMAVPAGCVLIGSSLIYNMITAWQRRGEGTLVYTRSDVVPPGQ